MQITSIKSRIKKLIQYIYFLFVPQVKMSSNYNFKVIGDKNFHYNVGYYDIDPVDSSGANILCHNKKLCCHLNNPYSNFILSSCFCVIGVFIF